MEYQNIGSCICSFSCFHEPQVACTDTEKCNNILQLQMCSGWDLTRFSGVKLEYVNTKAIVDSLFADDCVIYNTIQSPSDQEKLSINLQEIEKWCSTWQMVLNPDKSVIVSVTRKKNVMKYPYIIAGNEVNRVQQHKYLGLTFTSDLRWNTHIDNVCSKAYRVIWGLSRNIRNATPDVKLLSYITLVRPVIEYGKIVWDPYTASDIAKIEKVQRLASRFIYNKYRRIYSPTALCKQANLETLEGRTKVERMKFLFMLIHGHFKINTTQYFTVHPDQPSRHRHSMYIPVPLSHNNCFKYSFFPRVIKEWNQLPNSIVRSDSLDVFIDRLVLFVHHSTPRQ